MKIRCALRLFSLVLLALLVVEAAAAQSLEGMWYGTLDAGVKLRLLLRVTKGPDGTFTAKLDSLDQGVTIPVSSIGRESFTVTFELKQIGASFRGTIGAESRVIIGQWSQMGAVLPLAFEKTDKVPETPRPQEPRKPYPYNEAEVSYANPQEGVRLSGTFTWPRTTGPFPAALLITGSIQRDRNAAIMGHRPFLVLADYLTRHGFAVLRVDNRGVGGSTGNPLASSIKDFASDSLAGLAFLKTQKEIDPKRIGLIGHGEGALVAPLAAVQSPDVAFVVMLAGSGLNGEQVLYAQGELLAKVTGAGPADVERQRELQKRLFGIVKEEKDGAAREKRIRQTLKDAFASAHTEDQAATATLEKTMEGQVQMMTSPGFRFFLTYDPAETLRKLRCPVLDMSGEKDLQVPPGQNLPAIVAALETGGNPDYQVSKLPRLNHMFQTAETGSILEYSQIEETFAPAALEVLAEWLGRHVRKN